MSKVFDLKEDAQFQENVLQSSKPVLVKFGAQWCGPCQMIQPFLEKKSVEDDKIDIVTIDIDDFPELEEKYNISNLPTYILFNKGDEVGRTFGVKEEKINELIAKC